MELIQIISLALLQGLTEFLPISSSAHLILVPQLLGWPDQGLAFDVAVHIGTLAAVVFYFRQELGRMLGDWLGSLAGRGLTADARLAWAVGFGTIPVGLAGLLFKDVIETSLRSPLVIAATTVGFGLLLGWADHAGSRRRDEHSIGWKDVLLIGVAQAVALIPGTSRSGITMTAGLLAGLSREAAARFSFLLSIPVILLAGGLETRELLASPVPVDWTALSLGAALSALSAYLCIHFFLKLLARIGFMPFVVYRLLLGAVLLLIFA
ncbi:undecaprenyl-diphosphate phosphatase [Thiohalobacter sp. IOR34]|uniref:undecaprenyl-diphosphate phosphatase n=1 Tax=Thiohalobacter sp. IOR34 TaxID=3057176 RepID=UPI0025AFB539|nr:undecaprenyl-diphosphate phosphatase [Thiohalobacter sp. IOR34]WJW75369.1 undecaprenyl-diphosphate phosphatase [Thiohalobacter sp. IOR34]